VRLLHDPPKISALFDDRNLVSRAGLMPLMGLAERSASACFSRAPGQFCSVITAASAGSKSRDHAGSHSNGA